MAGINALAPNRMGHFHSNRGMEFLTSNRGYGVDLVNPKPSTAKTDKLNSLRVSSARQFGKKKTQVGF